MKWLIKIFFYIFTAQLGVHCRDDNDCKTIPNGKCSEYKKCSCKDNYAQYNNTSCALLLGEYCSKDKLCAPLNSSCTNNVCTCDKGFFAKSSHSCLQCKLMFFLWKISVHYHRFLKSIKFNCELFMIKITWEWAVK